MGLGWDELPLPTVPLVASIMRTLKTWRKSTPKKDSRKKAMGMHPGGRAHPGHFILRVLKAGTLGEEKKIQELAAKESKGLFIKKLVPHLES